jgi:hypothetical protein
MPVLPGSSTTNPITVQQLANQLRVYPEYTPVFGTSGFTQEPILTMCNDVLQRFLAEGLPWKWNRSYVPSILTVALQQDYCTQLTDIGWLENCVRIDINNSTNNGNLAPKPIFMMEAIRDLQQTSYQGIPFNVSFIPNTLAFMGQWMANTPYGCGYGVAQIPITPIQQFIDINGNILYIDSTVLGLNINSPGFAGQPVSLPSNSPYGISGSTAPQAPPNATPGTKVQDNTVIWTVADPNAYAIRVAPLPAFSGLAWLIPPVYQRKPPTLTSLQDRINPIPPEFNYLFRQGLRASLYDHAGSPKAESAFAKWLQDLNTALRSGDRQTESFSMYPGEPVVGGSPYGYEVGIGASWPYGPTGFGQ